MMLDAIELATGYAFVLLLIGIAISLPYALREMRKDWTKLRGQFGVAFCLICVGEAGRLMLRYASMQITSELPTGYWHAVEPVTLLCTILFSLGMKLAIRSMTVERSGERMWVWSAVGAGVVSVAMWAMV
jgi:hypothetical protein